MIISNQHKSKNKQSGIALLILVIAIALAISSYYFSTISIVDIKVDNIEKTRKTLKQAKHALLAYAMNYTNTPAGLANSLQGPGNFPCPDDDLDGASDAVGAAVVIPGCNSTGAGTMGRFPWSTVGTEELRDASGELLWYAVSANFVNAANQEINTATTGEITVRSSNGGIRNDGTTIDGIVAVIIAPGKILQRDDGTVQRRITAAEQDDPENYLDIARGEDNASFTNSSADGFIMGTVRDINNDVIVNDLIVTITYSELMSLIHAQVGEEVSALLNDYLVSCDAYPEASVFNPTKAAFDSAGMAPPNELREGHLPLGTALPVDWGWDCDPGAAVVLAPTPVAWLADEGWDKMTYYAFAYQNAPTVPSLPCGPAVPNPTCLTVNNTPVPVDDKQALVIFSGRDTTVGLNRPSANVTDYFEGENNTLNGVYDADETEDYIRVIAP